MKRKEVDRRISQLLDRIDGELAEVRDGLIQVDERSARHQARITDLESRLQSLEGVTVMLAADFRESVSSPEFKPHWPETS